MADKVKHFEVSGDKGSAVAQFNFAGHPDLLYKISTADVGGTLFGALVNAVIVAYEKGLKINVVGDNDRNVRGVEFVA
jgi:hypothetical protein